LHGRPLRPSNPDHASFSVFRGLERLRRARVDVRRGSKAGSAVTPNNIGARCRMGSVGCCGVILGQVWAFSEKEFDRDLGCAGTSNKQTTHTRGDKRPPTAYPWTCRGARACTSLPVRAAARRAGALPPSLPVPPLELVSGEEWSICVFRSTARFSVLFCQYYASVATWALERTVPAEICPKQAANQRRLRR